MIKIMKIPQLLGLSNKYSAVQIKAIESMFKLSRTDVSPFGKVLGKGACAEVFQCTHKGEQIAVKCVCYYMHPSLFTL